MVRIITCWCLARYTQWVLLPPGGELTGQPGPVAPEAEVRGAGCSVHIPLAHCVSWGGEGGSRSCWEGHTNTWGLQGLAKICLHGMACWPRITMHPHTTTAATTAAASPTPPPPTPSHTHTQALFDSILSGLLARVTDHNGRVQEAACSGLAEVLEHAGHCTHGQILVPRFKVGAVFYNDSPARFQGQQTYP